MEIVNQSSIGKELGIQVFEKEEALAVLSNLEFTEQWNNLCKTSSGFNAIVSPKFLKPWFDFRHKSHEPIIIVGKLNNDRVVGVFPLAKIAGDKRLAIAGDNDAEYHSWIVDERWEKSFLQESFKLIQRMNPKDVWEWHFLPPGRSAEILLKLEIPGIYVHVEKGNTGYWNLSDEKHLLHHSRPKSSAGRYRKQLEAIGETRLEKILSGDRLKEILEIAKYHKDFRHQAFYGHSLFAQNRGLIEFCAEMMEHSAGHNMALWQNGELIAFSNYITDGKIAYAGITAYEPSLVKFKLGHMMIVNHARQLISDGIQFIDLTPGQDEYKNSYATEYKEIYKPTFYFSRIAYLKGRIRNSARARLKKGLSLVGSNPKKLKLFIAKIRTESSRFLLLRKAKGMLFAISKAIYDKVSRSLFDASELTVNVVPENIKKHWKVSINDHEKLRFYHDYRPHVGLNSLLLWAWIRYNKKERIITITNADRLLFYGAISDATKDIYPSNLVEPFTKFKDGIICYDTYFNSAMEPMEKAYCLQVIKENIDHEKLYFILDNMMIPDQKNGSILGMTSLKTLTRKRLFMDIFFKN